MSIIKELSFDFVAADIKLQSRHDIYRMLSQALSPSSETNEKLLKDLLLCRWANSVYQMGEGVAVLEIAADEIQAPSLSLVRFDREIEFELTGLLPVKVLAVVLSPKSGVAKHLQKLATVTRILRSRDLCEALQDAKDEDEIRTLFTPSHNWMMAA